MTDERTAGKSTEPKFVPGEEVAVKDTTSGAFDRDLVMIEDVKYGFTPEAGRGWYYRTEHIEHDELYFVERVLHKLPANTVTQWNNCIWEPG